MWVPFKHIHDTIRAIMQQDNGISNSQQPTIKNMDWWLKSLLLRVVYVRVLPRRPGFAIQIVPKIWTRRYVASMVGAAMVTSVGMVWDNFVVLCAVVDALISLEPFWCSAIWYGVWSVVIEVLVGKIQVVDMMVEFNFLKAVSFRSSSAKPFLFWFHKKMASYV